MGSSNDFIIIALYCVECVLVSLCAKSLQSCLTLCDPMDCSPPGSPVHGILQPRLLIGLPCPHPGILLTQGSNLRLFSLPHWQVGSLPGKPVSLLSCYLLSIYYVPSIVQSV